MNKRASLFTFLLLSFAIVSPVFSQLQSPEEFLGYELGQRWTPHHNVLDYVTHIADESDYAIIEKYGETYEHRDLVYLVITTPENHENLEEIRLNNLRMTGLEDGEITSNRKAIVWLSYNVHGNETSSSEAAMKTLYELVQPENQESKNWLENTVVIMDPMINPDGRDRYIYWYKQMVGEEPDASYVAREHHEPWPGGRSNHYLFDLNRDWAWQVQV
ncbi:MAG: M14 family zinc carboxypeptidase, partial [Balneolaceae bacterium]|nr:M14 family zinc carboxypeptidase [Balneolaceae bacterium]